MDQMTDWRGQRWGYFLVFIIYFFIEFGVTHLSEHFCKDLSGMAASGLFIVFFLMFLSFRLQLSEGFSKGKA